MQTQASNSLNPERAPEADRDEALRHLPEAAQHAFKTFQQSGDVQQLDPVIVAILEDFIPKQHAKPLAEVPGDSRLMEDLGFDSLAITEVVFFTEDLLGIRIANEEIIQVRTLDDLRGFVRRKVSERGAT
ncbi:acyl carrier protein [Oleiharenicola lentus]|uniref:acyl carrier protein n=1 Tax=Oleiharenicola lentus TaxID=2508720 RepID=UPI003F66E9F7